MGKFDWKRLEEKAEGLILDMVTEAGLDGAAKRAHVVDRLIDYLDDEVFVFEGKGQKFKEVATDAVLFCIRALLSLLVQHVYDRLKQSVRL